MMQKSELTQFIKAEALRLGFTVCGIAQATNVDTQTASTVEQWVNEGRNGTMSYLERNSEKRTDPRLLVPGCRSIICVALNYFTDSANEEKLHISRYARGSDYHKVVKDRLYLLLQAINSKQSVTGRPFCDTAPILERYWAVRAGIGWIGKNHQLIIPGQGTHFFLGELLIDAELEYDTPLCGNRCGECSKCLNACPTNALTVDGFDARKCLSYLTIEYDGELPENIGEKMGKCFYGCDRCQSCCPHNKFASPTEIPEFVPKSELLAMSEKEWYELTEEKYKSLFNKTAVERCGFRGLKRNIDATRKAPRKE